VSIQAEISNLMILPLKYESVSRRYQELQVVQLSATRYQSNAIY